MYNPVKIRKRPATAADLAKTTATLFIDIPDFASGKRYP